MLTSGDILFLYLCIGAALAFTVSMLFVTVSQALKP